jgi:hypothetical protein
MARTPQILTACEQFHHFVCSLDKAYGVQEGDASNVTYGN